MFCPNCGTAEQRENSYCRNCGEFLPDLSVKNKLAFGGNTPEEQIRTNLVLNLLSALVSLILAVVLYATFWNRGDTLPIIYIVAAFLLAMCGWQFSTFVVGLKLKKNFDKRKSSLENDGKNQEKVMAFESAQTKERLPEADFNNVVSTSVTENTTRHLSEKANRKSS
jgi:hypothetical protein